MSEKLILDNKQVMFLAEELSHVLDDFPSLIKCYPIPRGGIPAAYALLCFGEELEIVETPEEADFFMDDIIDSGKTKARYAEGYSEKPFFALIDKTGEHKNLGWVVFPWEHTAEAAIEDNIVRLLQYIGEDVTRGGLLETPKRVAKAWDTWSEGYGMNPADVMKVFEDGGENYDEMVVVKDIPFYSHCVVGSTFVDTPRGRIPISKLKDGDLIYTMDPDTFELDITKCSNPRITQRDAKLVAVHTDNDTVICTPEHRFLTTAGTWVEAQNLKNNDRLASLYKASTNPRDTGNIAYPTLISTRFSRKFREGALQLCGEVKTMIEHRFILTKTTGSAPTRREGKVTHHIDEQVWNNLPSNLEVITTGEHNEKHQRTQKLATSENRKKKAAASSGRPEVRAKRAASVKAYWARIKGDKEAYDERCKQTADGIQSSGRNHTVYGIEHLAYTEDVWCMTVPETHLFFANGMASHNCEHHMAPFFGTATIGYIPKGKIVGLSKLSRLLNVFARRLQVQERLTNQVAEALVEHLDALGAGVVIRARHLCCESRGISQQGHHTVTSSLRGVMKTQPDTRAEFMSLCNDGVKL